MGGEAAHFCLTGGGPLGRAADATRAALPSAWSGCRHGELASSQLTFSFIKLKARIKSNPHNPRTEDYEGLIFLIGNTVPKYGISRSKEASFTGSSQTVKEASFELPAGPEKCWPLASRNQKTNRCLAAGDWLGQWWSLRGY